MLLGCVADDLTGATDLALTLTREGLRTVQTTGLPAATIDTSGVDALVVALKSRTIPAGEAVDMSLAAATALRQRGATRLLFKYCSTFDSTDSGNIGPVLEALLEFTGAPFTLACPAFPKAGRTVYAGHLFVNGVPLDESPMKDHPLTPMRDSDLRRVLGRQTALAVGHVAYEDVDAGAGAVEAAFARERLAGKRALVVDALTDAHLRTIGAAAVDLPLITGGSGIAIGLPRAYLDAGHIDELVPAPTRMEAPPGRAAILAGSCSAATRGQVAAALAAGLPAFRLDPFAIAAGDQSADAVLAWLDGLGGDAAASARPPLIYSSADPADVGRAQEAFGREPAGRIIEDVLAGTAAALPARGYTRLIVAGGETAGAAVAALGAAALAIGPEIDPGVPWTRTVSGPALALALKSGNFGGPDFFLKAWSRLD